MVQLEVPTEHALSNTAARFPSWSLAMLGLTVMVGLGGVMYAFRGERQRLEGLFLIKDVEGNLVSTVDLSSLGNKASIGREGTVVIPDDESLPIAARVSARRVNDAIEILWQQLDGSRTVITEYPLHHGDIEQVGRFVLEYQNFAQEVVDDLMFEEEIWDEN
ncbi:MAG: hypothetical protein KDE31_37305 [Caldilineaceae bacterium]|nr:hypothetical protein [Caldilineaceae bacterium]